MKGGRVLLLLCLLPFLAGCGAIPTPDQAIEPPPAAAGPVTTGAARVLWQDRLSLASGQPLLSPRGGGVLLSAFSGNRTSTLFVDGRGRVTARFPAASPLAISWTGRHALLAVGKAGHTLEMVGGSGGVLWKMSSPGGERFSRAVMPQAGPMFAWAEGLHHSILLAVDRQGTLRLLLRGSYTAFAVSRSGDWFALLGRKGSLSLYNGIGTLLWKTTVPDVGGGQVRLVVNDRGQVTFLDLQTQRIASYREGRLLWSRHSGGSFLLPAPGGEGVASYSPYRNAFYTSTGRRFARFVANRVAAVTFTPLGEEVLVAHMPALGRDYLALTGASGQVLFSTPVDVPLVNAWLRPSGKDILALTGNGYLLDLPVHIGSHPVPMSQSTPWPRILWQWPLPAGTGRVAAGGWGVAIAYGADRFGSLGTGGPGGGVAALSRNGSLLWRSGGTVTRMAVARGREEVLVARQSGEVELLGPFGRRLWHQTPHLHQLRLLLSSGGRFALIGGEGQTSGHLQVYDANSSLVWRKSWPGMRIGTVAVADGGRVFAALLLSTAVGKASPPIGELRVWNRAGRRLLRVAGVDTFALSPHGRQVAMVRNGKVERMGIGGGPATFVAVPRGQQVRELKFLPSGRSLLWVSDAVVPAVGLSSPARVEEVAVIGPAGHIHWQAKLPGLLGRLSWSGNGQTLAVTVRPAQRVHPANVTAEQGPAADRVLLYGAASGRLLGRKMIPSGVVDAALGARGRRLYLATYEDLLTGWRL